MLQVIALAVCTVLVLTLNASGQSIDEKITAMLVANNFSGVASVWKGDATTRYAAAQVGYRNVAAQLSYESDTRFPVGSNTKLYVTIALYQLQEIGIVNLSHSVAEYLDQSDFAAFGYPNQTRYCPTVPGKTTAGSCETVTFVELLAMSAGLDGDDENMFMPYPGSIAAFVGWFINVPLLFTPGTQYYYSNPSFMLSAYFVEKFSGLSFEDYLKKHIFSVVGLKSTYYDPYNGKFGIDNKRTLEYYSYIDPTTKEQVAIGSCSSELDLGSANGAGGIVSDQHDEALLYFTLFNLTNKGKPLLQNPQSLLDIIRPRTPFITGVYYAQGIYVGSQTLDVEVPEFVTYEGQTVCSHTLNTIFLKGNHIQVMTQLWSAVQVAYANESSLALIAGAKTGSFFDDFESFPHRATLREIQGQLLTLI